MIEDGNAKSEVAGTDMPTPCSVSRLEKDFGKTVEVSSKWFTWPRIMQASKTA